MSQTIEFCRAASLLRFNHYPLKQRACQSHSSLRGSENEIFFLAFLIFSNFFDFLFWRMFSNFFQGFDTILEPTSPSCFLSRAKIGSAWTLGRKAFFCLSSRTGVSSLQLGSVNYSTSCRLLKRLVTLQVSFQVTDTSVFVFIF